MTFKYNRRNFLKQTTAAGAGITLLQSPLKIFAGGKTIAFVDFEDIPVKDVNREPSIIVKSRGFIEFE